MDNSIFNYWFYILPAFILGSIPSGYLLTKILFKKDVRQYGSKNIGSTNVGRTFGSKYGYITLFLDMLKGYIGVLISYNLLTSKYISLENPQVEHVNLIISFLPLFAVLGHAYSPFMKWKGGKGVATTFGSFIFFNFEYMLICLSAYLITIKKSKFVSLGSIISTCLLPLTSYLYLEENLKIIHKNGNYYLESNDYTSYILIQTLPIIILVMFLHRENIKRLKEGSESQIK
ncbi:acyl-phosphate glycerol 3-phosphate acyltransferase [bacterium]|nr:acyl-phosphate glycerol 3-phosphate acyltransferase [bacterium]|tara:strand:- start:35261 stop:35953 length:693 start_codon:yes stop_codon:yes gene_type:complete